MDPAKSKQHHLAAELAPTRILVAMSGGVDSSVAAALLLEAGHELVGVTMHLWNASGDEQVGRCCAPEDRDDARRVCDYLGIPHYVIDEREAFRAEVVEPLIDEYLAGRTPSPCVHCNKTVKLTQLSGIADRFGATHIATGHYTRVEEELDRVRLFRGRDRLKDQSYFLFGVPEATLARLVFPLGTMEKNEAREHARRLGLPNAEKPDSQELCFIPDGDVRGFVARERGEAPPGAIRTEDGAEIGRHEGIAGYTVGQRRGLGIGGGPARYVLEIHPESQTVVVGDGKRLFGDEFDAGQVTWVQPPSESSFEATVRIRHRHEPAPAEVTATATGFRVKFRKPQRAITPGQAAVVYQGDEVLGGGFIR